MMQNSGDEVRLSDDDERSSIHDIIGFWSEIKLQIMREYLPAYSKILRNQTSPTLYHLYVDAFAGSGQHFSKESQTMVAGSPSIALDTVPPFREYKFIDMDEQKVASLEKIAANRQDVHIYHGDCNEILRKQVLPDCRFEDYKRALCVLDPYGLQLDWQIVEQAGKMKSVEVFINFPILDINRNVLRRSKDKVYESSASRMTRFWGDESWLQAGYHETQTLFGPTDEKSESREVVQAYRDRLRKVAGFSWVPEPMPMKNSKGGVVYYLFFASHRPVAASIIESIFNKYRRKGFG